MNSSKICNLKLKQTDLILLDFSKAFDKVAHENLYFKLLFYGLRGNTLNCIKDFLDKISQSVLLNGSISDNTPVSTGLGSRIHTISSLYIRPHGPDKVKRPAIR